MAVQQWGDPREFFSSWAEGCDRECWICSPWEHRDSPGTQAMSEKGFTVLGGIPWAKDSDNTRATPRGDFAHAARI